MQNIKQELAIIVVAAIHAELYSEGVNLCAEECGLARDDETPSLKIQRERLKMSFRRETNSSGFPVVRTIAQAKQGD